MFGRFRRFIRFSHVVSLMALIAAMGGTSYAAVQITGAQIVDGSITGKDLRNRSVKGIDVAPESLGSRQIKGLKKSDFAPGELPLAGAAAKGDKGDRGPKGDIGDRGPKGRRGRCRSGRPDAQRPHRRRRGHRAGQGHLLRRRPGSEHGIRDRGAERDALARCRRHGTRSLGPLHPRAVRRRALRGRLRPAGLGRRHPARQRPGHRRALPRDDARHDMHVGHRLDDHPGQQPAGRRGHGRPARQPRPSVL